MIDTKWTKDGEIATVTNALKLMITEGDADVVRYRDSAQNPHIMLRTDFLEQYQPAPVYEYQYCFTTNTYQCLSSSYYTDEKAKIKHESKD